MLVLGYEQDGDVSIRMSAEEFFLLCESCGLKPFPQLGVELPMKRLALLNEAAINAADMRETINKFLAGEPLKCPSKAKRTKKKSKN